MFRVGQKVRKNSSMSNEEFERACNGYSTDADLIQRLLEAEVFTISHINYDDEYTDVRFEEFENTAPWVLANLLEQFNNPLEEVEEV